MAWATPSVEKRSGRTGKNSTSTWSSSTRSMSEPSIGSRERSRLPIGSHQPFQVIVVQGYDGPPDSTSLASVQEYGAVS